MSWTVLHTTCASIYTYTVLSLNGELIDISLSGAHENVAYSSNGNEGTFVDNITGISFLNTLTFTFSIPNSGKAGSFLDVDVAVHNQTEVLTLNDNVDRKNDDRNCNGNTNTTGVGEKGQVTVWDGPDTLIGDPSFTYTVNELTFLFELMVQGIIIGDVFKTPTGLPSEFLKADGSIDSSVYSTFTTEDVQDIMGATLIDGTDTTVVYDDNAGTIRIDSNVAGDKTYTHNQSSPATVWSIAHNLNKHPSVSVVDSSNSRMEGQVDYIDTNNITLTFNASFSGKAFFN